VGEEAVDEAHLVDDKKTEDQTYCAGNQAEAAI
jgi:hypothetical protein